MIDFFKNLFGASRQAPVPATPEPSPAPPAAESPLEHYARLCRAAGIDRLYLLLTFDCDTDFDIGVVRDVDRDLRSRGVKAGYAVPGAQLKKSPSVWREVADQGSEFLNHGNRAHAEFRDGRYWPATFYEKLSQEEVAGDIRDGHRTVVEVAGVAPVGFRAPHFGSFQDPSQLKLIYDTVRPLGYTYCSTTIPSLGLARGPVVDVGQLAELPTMGSYRYPTTLLDSWTYLTDRVNYALGDEYGELFTETVERMTQERIPGLLTYYADPSHVFGQKPFERALDAIRRFDVATLHGRDVVRRFRAS
jgi:peptidoglycan/xylan/chitin deacetylase (PgdA/CDA1 family)